MICFSIKLEQQSGLIFFFQNALHESINEFTESVGLINLFVDSLDHIYGKMPKLLEQHE